MSTPPFFSQRSRWPFPALVLAGVLWCGFAACGQSVARDFTFIVCSDTHVGAENLKADPPVTPAQTLARLRDQLDLMGGWVGRPYPARAEFDGLPAGGVAQPRGLFTLGDLTDGHKELPRQQAQWSEFETLFPVSGVALGSGTVPVFALAGNHDGDLDGPQRRGLVARNRALQAAGRLAAISTNGAHFAVHWEGVHLVSLGLCPADTTDAETPFKYGRPGAGSWNDPQGALTFLRDYLVRHVGSSGEPVLLLQHYGFDGFSLNDWNWWTLKQRRAFYELLKDYHIVAILHGHNHHAERYQWPDPRRHAAEVAAFFDGEPPAQFRQYDVLSCGTVGWLFRVCGDRLIAVHLTGADWPADSARFFAKSLRR
jgi:hypothetical protein